MEFIKAYKDTNSDYGKIVDEYFCQDLVANFLKTKIYIRNSCLFVNGEKFNITECVNNFFLFEITENFSLLCSGREKYHYLIHIINGTPLVSRIEGTPTYINKSGYLMFTKETFFELKKIIFSGHNIYETQKYYLKSETNYFLKGYLLYRMRNGKITVYIEKESFMEDFDGANDIPIEYYFMTKPLSLKNSDVNILVKFKDTQNSIPITKLKSLESTFINDQLSNSDEMYLDLNYSEFENETLEFLEYIKSYLLHESLQNELIETIINAIGEPFRCKRTSLIKRVNFLR